MGDQSRILRTAVQVNPDCTATVTYTSGSLQGADLVVILDYGNVMHSIPTRFPLGPFSGIFNLRRIASYQAQCGGYLVRGVYAGSREGSQMVPVAGQSQPAAVPFSAIHTATFENGGIGTAASTA